jgi:hypothetical protein
MVRRTNTKRNLRASLYCALGLAAILAWTPAQAGDDSTDEAPDVKFLRNLLEGIGLQNPDTQGIDYRERAPLVIPPNSNLLPPETDVVKNPNWPVDPDVKRAKEIKALERNAGYDTSAKMEEHRRPLLPDKLNVGPRRNSSRDASSMTYKEAGPPLKPSQLGYRGGLFSNMFGKKDETAKFIGEPPRVSLTDPPPGYQTPSPDQPYGVGAENPKVPTSNDYYINHPVPKD